MTRSLAMFFACCAALAMPVTFLAGCSDDDGDAHGAHGDDHDDGGDPHHDHSTAQVGPPSGAKCPANSTLTYGNFGEKFFKDYCLRCHSEKVKGDARMNAPADHNFDTLAEIELLANHIDQMAASGPSHTNQT